MPSEFELPVLLEEEEDASMLGCRGDGEGEREEGRFNGECGRVRDTWGGPLSPLTRQPPSFVLFQNLFISGREKRKTRMSILHMLSTNLHHQSLDAG